MQTYILSAFADEASNTLEGQMDALDRNGIRNMDIRNLEGRSISEYSPAEAKEVRKRLNDRGICVAAIGSPIGKISICESFAPHLDLFRRMLETADILGASRMRIFSFYMPPGEDPGAYRNQVFERLHQLIEISDETNVRCYHENEKDIYGDTAARNADMMKFFGGKLKCIFDPANYVQCKENPSIIFDRLAPYVDCFHIKDARLSDGSVVLPGHGDGAIEEILQKYTPKDDRTYLTIEPHVSLFDGYAALGDTTSIQNDYAFRSNDESFDAAVQALIKILDRSKLRYE
jgi:sugar phosphate isomerase/epimerase